MARKTNVQDMMERLLGAEGRSQAREPKVRREARKVRPAKKDELPPEPEARRTAPKPVLAAPSGELTARIADELAGRSGARSVDVAEKLGMDAIDVRDELIEMEKLGIVY